jgi:SRSO17 transposase
LSSYTYASSKGHALIDTSLYLPRAWADDAKRRHQARVPEELAFATKPELAVAMLKAALSAGAKAQWLLGDAVYGVHQVMNAAQQAGLGYVLGVTSQFGCGVMSAAERLAAVPPQAWQPFSAGDGAKGERLFAWALIHEWPQAEREGWTRRVIARRRLNEPDDIHLFIVRCPKEMGLAEIARLAGRRWAIEECFRTAKQKAGLADYEVRTWRAWQRHIRFAMAAAAALTLAAVAAAEKKPPARSPSAVDSPPMPSPDSSGGLPSPGDHRPCA